MEVFVHTEQQLKTHDFANVKPCDNKAKIIYHSKVKCADSIATDMNAVQ